MGTRKNPNASPVGKKKVNNVLTGHVNQLKMLNNQFLSLANDLKLQYEQKVTQVNLLQERISQMEKDFRVQEMERRVDAAKSDFLLGLKAREAFQYKTKLEDVESELADFKEMFHLPCPKCSDPKDIQNSGNQKGQEDDLLMELKLEVRKVKHENEMLSLKISDLSSEMDFMRKQFKKTPPRKTPSTAVANNTRSKTRTKAPVATNTIGTTF